MASSSSSLGAATPPGELPPGFQTASNLAGEVAVLQPAERRAVWRHLLDAVGKVGTANRKLRGELRDEVAVTPEEVGGAGE